MQNNLVETLIGAAVIAVALIFLTFAYRTSDAGGVGAGYTIKARVNNVTGITVGTDVRISGIKVGSVSKLELDPMSYEAVLFLSVDKRFELGSDTSMSVAAESLLGGNFVALQPGADIENLLQDGDELLLATGTVDLLSLVQQAIFGAGSSKNDADVSTSTPPAPSPQSAIPPSSTDPIYGSATPATGTPVSDTGDQEPDGNR